ncbi:hypothetical protein [Sphingomonas sp. Leaf38]|uniref:hypothetical protein n=1 Tax=Sphingomonas sp. Leaf38 TaxID=1736217 RepID=UPI0006F5CE8E|nr:hypothetical protein [Sphingomonas sp. Leaf38]KQN33587.1 hypothetical protein ASE88_00715 [Sphingomonas sp. Leaf38]
MTDGNSIDPSAADFDDTAKKSAEAGIADESAAYEQAIESDDEDDDQVAEGKWKSTDDGSGTSETD